MILYQDCSLHLAKTTRLIQMLQFIWKYVTATSKNVTKQGANVTSLF